MLELVWGQLRAPFANQNAICGTIQPTINAMVKEIIKDKFTIKAGFMESHHGPRT